ncbi:hypothetical protein SAMN05216188_101452 [Lentzea xinjiangensis]|uniref:Uncharacterized protein n=1 Tax=Lentzea xinjiangensis TaxID=402600 RepID=A0A1H9ALM7_9PSEU|nr:hypothetical protein SAMN05216188_101452 [Lentzea xinjiangensis]
MTSTATCRSTPAAASTRSASSRVPQSALKSTNGCPASSATATDSLAANGLPGAHASTSGSLARLRTRRSSAIFGCRVTNARSSRPARTSSTRSALPDWRILISTPGCSSWNRASTAGRCTTCRHCRLPTDNVPRSSPCTAATAALAQETLCRALRASGNSARPACVSSTCRVVRRNSGAPSSTSSARIDAERPDWATCMRLAALVKWHSSATARKYSSCLSSTIHHP